MTNRVIDKANITLESFSGSNALALESLCDAPRYSFFKNDKVYITHLGLLYNVRELRHILNFEPQKKFNRYLPSMVRSEHF